MELVLNTIFWTLAIYGLFEIVKNIIYLCTYTKLTSDGIYLIIAVKNQEEKIEGFVFLYENSPGTYGHVPVEHMEEICKIHGGIC